MDPHRCDKYTTVREVELSAEIVYIQRELLNRARRKRRGRVVLYLLPSRTEREVADLQEKS